MTAGDERQDEWRTGDAVVEAALVMDKLWGFGGWEVTQTHDSLRPYLLEETYELLDAIQSGDPVAIREELGDLLLQVLFHSRIAEAAGEFTVDDVAATLVTSWLTAAPTSRTTSRARWTSPSRNARGGPQGGREGPRILHRRHRVAAARPGARREGDLAGTQAGLPDELVPDELWVVRLGGDTSAEDELRKATLRFVARIRAAESAAHADGVAWGGLDGDAWRTYWSS